MRLNTGRKGKWPVRSKFSVNGAGARGQNQRAGNAGFWPKVWILLCMFAESRHRELTIAANRCAARALKTREEVLKQPLTPKYLGKQASLSKNNNIVQSITKLYNTWQNQVLDLISSPYSKFPKCFNNVFYSHLPIPPVQVPVKIHSSNFGYGGSDG